MHWKERLHQLVPSRETLAAHPWLSSVAHRLTEPQLWRLQHETVARGVAIGLFWAFVLPVAQILVATLHCVWWRANIPSAAAVTLVTNPLTIGFWLWLAYKFGALLLGDASAATMTVDPTEAGWFSQYGWPTLLGMGLFAVGGSALGYGCVKGGWRLKVWLKRRRIGARRKSL